MTTDKTTLQRIRETVASWHREDMATLAAMDQISGIVEDADAEEQRLKTMTEDAQIDREVRGL